MVSLDQVLLLQKKVEAAVEKIVSLESQIQDAEAKNLQLKKENDALRSKCAELTNALSSKTELVSNLEATQSKIETGILNALSKLDAVENAVLTNNSNSENSEPLHSDFNNFATDKTESENHDSLSETEEDIPNASFITEDDIEEISVPVFPVNTPQTQSSAEENSKPVEAVISDNMEIAEEKDSIPVENNDSSFEEMDIEPQIDFDEDSEDPSNQPDIF